MHGLIKKQFDAVATAATAPIAQTVGVLQTTVGSDAGPLLTVDDRARLIMGQDYPQLAPGQDWDMSNRKNYFAIQLLKTQVTALSSTVATTFPALTIRLTQAEANMAAMLEQQRADELALVSLQAFEQQTRQLAAAADAKAVAAQAKADANELAIAATQLQAQALISQQAAEELRTSALEAKQALTTAALTLVQTKQTADEAAIAAAQAAVATAQAKADAAQQSANTAQAQAATATKAAADAQTTATNAGSLASTANTAAANAQAAATTAQGTASTAINNAAAAQTAATAAQAAATAVGKRIRTKRVATNQMALGGTLTQVVTWDEPFADDKYDAIPELEGTGLLGLVATVTARTATTVTVQIKNTLGILLLAGAGTLTLTALHD